MQHGMPALKAGNLFTDAALIESAKDTARKMVDNDPSLSHPEYALLKDEFQRVYKGRLELLKVG